MKQNQANNLFKKNRDEQAHQAFSKAKDVDEKWKEKNYQKQLEYNREYHKKNKDKVSERKRKYYLENKDKILNYHQNNKDKRNEQRRLAYFKNPEPNLLRAKSKPKKQISEAIKRYNKKYPYKQKARAKAKWFIPIPNRTICQYGGCKDLAIARHHPDYSKPLEVMLLCKKHHYKIHIKPFKIFKQEAEVIING